MGALKLRASWLYTYKAIYNARVPKWDIKSRKKPTGTSANYWLSRQNNHVTQLLSNQHALIIVYHLVFLGAWNQPISYRHHKGYKKFCFSIISILHGHFLGISKGLLREFFFKIANQLRKPKGMITIPTIGMSEKRHFSHHSQSTYLQNIQFSCLGNKVFYRYCRAKVTSRYINLFYTSLAPCLSDIKLYLRTCILLSSPICGKVGQIPADGRGFPPI